MFRHESNDEQYRHNSYNTSDDGSSNYTGMYSLGLDCRWPKKAADVFVVGDLLETPGAPLETVPQMIDFGPAYPSSYHDLTISGES